MFRDELEKKVNEAEKCIYSFLPKEEGFQKTVFSAMNYTMTAGGKRLRPILMKETYKIFGGKGQEIYPFMAAIEMIHTYSLIHDDLPALDNDDYRRGRKTAHNVYGEAMAILAGDALLNYAYETACKAFLKTNNLEAVSKALTVLASKPGVYGMIGGQVVDVEMTGKEISREQMHFIYENKTGALIEAAMMIGAILAGADEDQCKNIEKIASDIGLAFQIQDDILDLVGDSSKLGKPVLSDEDNNKVTYVSIYGMEKAKRDVEKISQNAIANLTEQGYDDEFLKNLIISLVNREN